MTRLVSYFHVRIDTDARAPDRGRLVEAYIEAAPFGSAGACRQAVLAAYRRDFPHAAVTVADTPVLEGQLASGVYVARGRGTRR